MKNDKLIAALVKRPTKKILVSFIILFSTLFMACTKDEVVETIDVIEEAIETEATLDNINGEWIRFASTNPKADGMIIDMSGTSGKLVDKAGSNFEVGDIKWKSISPIDSENYSYEELGSDNSYYSAKMVLKVDDTLRISVDASGAGNIQKWVRKGEYIPTDTQGGDVTETLACNISEARTLKNGPAAIDYFVDCVVDITAALTIEPGVVIQFAENAGLGVYDGGSLNAVGTETEPIILSGESDIRGWWRGIHIETRSFANRLEQVRIENAGSNYVYCCNDPATLFLKGALIDLKDVYMANGAAVGLRVNDDTSFNTYSNVRIESHQDYPVKIAPKVLTAFDGLASDYTGNDQDFVFVTDGNIDEVTTWNQLNVPYLIEGKVMDITKAFTLEAGVNLIFQENGGLGVYDEGSLTVNGLDTNPVTMKGKIAVRGFWRGIHIETSSLENSLNYLQLSDAGGNYVYCCNEPGSIFLKDGIASIRNSVISNGKSYGIITKPAFEFNSFEGNTITTHEKAPMYISAKTMADLDGLASNYLGNDKDFLLIYGSDVTEEMTVQPNNVPYRIENGKVIDITARMNVEAGVEFIFEEGAGLGVYDNGIFNVIGTSAKKIIFRGAEDSVGFWRGIHTETNSTSNVIRYAEITNAGSNYVYCCNDPAALYIRSGQMTVENTHISKSGGCGIFLKSGASLTEDGNTFSQNTDDICN